jgi:hypothetical protein
MANPRNVPSAAQPLYGFLSFAPPGEDRAGPRGDRKFFANVWNGYENWQPWNRQGQPWVPRVGPYNSMDLDGAERTVKTWSGNRGVFPYPYIVGNVSGFLPMLDVFSRAFAFGKPPSGPGSGGTPIPAPFDQQFWTMPKVT